MGKQKTVADFTLEELVEAVADTLVARLYGSSDAVEAPAEKPAKKSKAKAKDEEPEDEDEGEGEEEGEEIEITKKTFLAKVEEAMDATSKDEVMTILAEYDCKNPKKADEADWEEIWGDLQDLIDDEGEGEEEEGEDEDYDVDQVKAMFAKAKKVDKDAATEVLEEYGMKTTRGLGGLEQEDLNEVYEALEEIFDDE